MDSDNNQPFPKRRRVMTPEEKEIIINVYKYVRRAWPDDGVSESDSDSHQEMNVRPANAVRNRRSRRRPISDIVDKPTLAEIRKKIYYFFHELGHGVPTPENILREINEDESLPNFALPTFRRVLRHLKYRHFVTRNRNDSGRRCETFSIPMI